MPASKVNLRPFLRSQLDVLFVALNPPTESNENGHYFSGSNSRFFHLLYLSGLITKPVDKQIADEIVFGSTHVNYKYSSFGVVDLIENLVESDSRQVVPQAEHVEVLVARIRKFGPRFVCVIHSKVRDVLNGHPEFVSRLSYGVCGAKLHNCKSKFVLNYFPNGNNIPDESKLSIFQALRAAL